MLKGAGMAYCSRARDCWSATSAGLRRAPAARLCRWAAPLLPALTPRPAAHSAHWGVAAGGPGDQCARRMGRPHPVRTHAAAAPAPLPCGRCVQRIAPAWRRLHAHMRRMLWAGQLPVCHACCLLPALARALHLPMRQRATGLGKRRVHAPCAACKQPAACACHPHAFSNPTQLRARGPGQGARPCAGGVAHDAHQRGAHAGGALAAHPGGQQVGHGHAHGRLVPRPTHVAVQRAAAAPGGSFVQLRRLLPTHAARGAPPRDCRRSTPHALTTYLAGHIDTRSGCPSAWSRSSKGSLLPPSRASTIGARAAPAHGASTRSPGSMQARCAGLPPPCGPREHAVRAHLSRHALSCSHAPLTAPALAAAGTRRSAWRWWLWATLKTQVPAAVCCLVDSAAGLRVAARVGGGGASRGAAAPSTHARFRLESLARVQGAPCLVGSKGVWLQRACTQWANARSMRAPCREWPPPQAKWCAASAGTWGPLLHVLRQRAAAPRLQRRLLAKPSAAPAAAPAAAAAVKATQRRMRSKRQREAQAAAARAQAARAAAAWAAGPGRGPHTSSRAAKLSWTGGRVPGGRRSGRAGMPLRGALQARRARAHLRPPPSALAPPPREAQGALVYASFKVPRRRCSTPREFRAIITVRCPPLPPAAAPLLQPSPLPNRSAPPPSRAPLPPRGRPRTSCSPLHSTTASSA